jgi:hypothetical protein
MKQGFVEHHNGISLQATLKETNANYWGFKAKKDTLSIKRSKLQRDYMHMEETLLKQ